MPTDPATLTGWDLSCAVAVAAGWRDVRAPGPGDDGRWRLSARRIYIGTHPEVGIELPVPAYHGDETACFRDLLPMLKQAGWSDWGLYNVIDEAGQEACVEAVIYRGAETVAAGASEPAEAFCHAFLAAMSEEASTDE
jgi:hypothetical protein